MLRNFIRDRGTQLTLGTFVATFVFAVLALGSVSHGDRGDFVPHLSITVALVLVLADLGVLIYFIHHVAMSIQLPQVIASIASDLSVAIDAELATASTRVTTSKPGRRSPSCSRRIDEAGAVDPRPDAAATSSSWRTTTLVGIAAEADAVHPPAPPPRPLRRRGASARHGLAGRGRRRRSAGARTGACHRPAPHARAGPRVRHRPARGDRDPGAVAGGQRHVHRADVHRLARRRPVQDLGALEPAPRSPRRRGQRPGDRRRRAVRTDSSSAPSTRSARRRAACRR